MKKPIVRGKNKTKIPRNVIPISKGVELPEVPPLPEGNQSVYRKIPKGKKVKSSEVKNWEPTDEQRRTVALLVAHGHTPEEIAMVIYPGGPISYTTVIRKFKHELEYGSVYYKTWLTTEIVKKIPTPNGGLLAITMYKELYGSASEERKRMFVNQFEKKEPEQDGYMEKAQKNMNAMMATLPSEPKDVENG